MFQVPTLTIFLQVNTILELSRSDLTPSSESSLESYKRGAFLEKTDRFSKDKPGTRLTLRPPGHLTLNPRI